MRPLTHPRVTLCAVLLAVAVLPGCASKNAMRSAQAKSVEIAGQRFELGGTYDTRDRNLTLTVNGDPVMRGSFAPYTPTQTLTANYRGQEVRAQCYFGSVLSSNRGKVGIIAGAIQGSKGKAGDQCDITVAGSKAESLYF